MSSSREEKSSKSSGIPTGIIDPIPNKFRNQMPTALMSRKGFSKAGKPATIQLNSYIVEQWPTINVFQYDVSLPHPLLCLQLLSITKIVIGSGAEKRGLVAAVWTSQKVKSEIQRYGPGFIYDMNKIGW